MIFNPLHGPLTNPPIYGVKCPIHCSVSVNHSRNFPRDILNVHLMPQQYVSQFHYFKPEETLIIPRGGG